ncbi:MAG: hypothetical protein LUJ25_03895 [Firmicutes bacterium]|nr:hypothetical protein [Bacillota bacterium]
MARALLIVDKAIIRRRRRRVSPTVVWYPEKKSGVKDLLAVIRRIFMGLKEGNRERADKGRSKSGILLPICDLSHEGAAVGLRGCEPSKEKILVLMPKGEPFKEGIPGDGEAFTNLLGGEMP